jgi:hypothetical protein
MTEFDAQLPRANQTFELLPLFHTCDAYNARKHIRKSALFAPKCDVFDEELVYLFYGRPAFKYKTEEGANRSLSLYPIAFVFDALQIPEIARIFPFDSGAMSAGMYKRHFHPEMTYLDFELKGDTSRISDLIIQFFQSNKRYLDFKNVDTDRDSFDFESQQLAELYRALSTEPADERRATIEIQAANGVSINSNSLTAIIVPEELAGDESLKAFIKNNGAIIETYPALVWNPSQCFGILQQAARRFINQKYDLDKE